MAADPGADITYSIWQDTINALDQHYRVQKLKYYLNGEYYDAQQPLENLTVLPGITFFFGPKVVNLCIIGEPIGWKVDDSGDWVESWPPTDFVAATATHKAMYPKWTSYKTYIWLDYIIVKMIEDKQSNTKMRTMMDALEGRIMTMCSDLAAFGFTYMGRFTSQPAPSVFYPFLDPLFNL